MKAYIEDIKLSVHSTGAILICLFIIKMDMTPYLDLYVLSLVPVVVYSNADTQKFEILKENRGKFGIYCWTNKKTGFSYVGSSVDLTRRFRDYFNVNYLTRPGRKMIIYNTLLKNGYSVFKLEILEYCLPEEIVSREQFYMDLLKPKYNILKSAGTVLGFNHNELTKNKIRLARTGIKHSEETKLKIGSYRGIELVVTNLETKETVIYYSVRQAARELNTSSITIRRYTKSQKAFGGVYLIREKEISSP
jgi:hypothetical protein